MNLFKKNPHVCWILSWDARTGPYSHSKKRVSMIFLDKKEAIAYKKSLEQAKKLLQDSDDIEIKFEKNKQYGYRE